MKFLIVGGYCHGNPGDEAILKSTIYRLEEMCPGSHFTIWTSNPEFAPKFDRPVSREYLFWRPLPALKGAGFAARLLTKLYGDFFPLSRRLALWFFRAAPPPRVIRRLAGYDWAVFVGGGYLNSKFALLDMNFLASVFRREGQRYVLLGQTLGLFDKPSHRRMASEIFEGAVRIVLRETLSLRETVGFREKVAIGIDQAVAFEPRLTQEAKNRVDRYFGEPQALYFGVNLRDWKGSRAHYSLVAKSLATFAAAAGRPVKFLFVPMETCDPDDRVEGRALAEQLDPKLDYSVVEENLTIEEKFRLIGRLDAFAGMRLHALVFALTSGVPAAGLYLEEYYRRKVCGLFEVFGVPDQVVSLEKAAELPWLLRESYADREGVRTRLTATKQRIVAAQNEILTDTIKPQTEDRMKISVIIPTMNRAADLKAALDSIMAQTLVPGEIVVVDQSTNNQTKIVVSETKLAHPAVPVTFRYVVQEEKSLVKARNRGLSHATGDIISFLDDDVVLFPDYFELVAARFEGNPSLGGLSGNTLVKEKCEGFKWKLRKALMAVFLLNGFNGRMTPSGFGYPVYEREIDRAMNVDMLPGCNMNYRRSVIGDQKFDEWFTGYGFREDVDFSYRMSRKAKLIMIPEAKLHHNYATGNRLDVGALKKMEMRNYRYLFLKHKRKSPLAAVFFAYSVAGLTLIDLMEFLTTWKTVKFAKFRAGIGSTMAMLLGRS